MPAILRQMSSLSFIRSPFFRIDAQMSIRFAIYRKPFPSPELGHNHLVIMRAFERLNKRKETCNNVLINYRRSLRGLSGNLIWGGSPHKSLPTKRNRFRCARRTKSFLISVLQRTALARWGRRLPHLPAQVCVRWGERRPKSSHKRCTADFVT